MSEADDEAVIGMAEKIARIAMGDINLDEYQTILYKTGGMLSAWKMMMKGSGFSEYFIEQTSWMIMTCFFGYHLHNTEIKFEPPTAIQQRGPSDDSRGTGNVPGVPGRTES